MTPDSQALSLLAEVSLSDPTHSLPRDAPLVRTYEELVQVASEAVTARGNLAKASEALQRVQGVARGASTAAATAAAATAPHTIWSDLTAMAVMRSPLPRTAGEPGVPRGSGSGGGGGGATSSLLFRAPGVAGTGAIGGQSLRPIQTSVTILKRSGFGSGPPRFSSPELGNGGRGAKGKTQRNRQLDHPQDKAPRDRDGGALDAATATSQWSSWVSDFTDTQNDGIASPNDDWSSDDE